MATFKKIRKDGTIAWYYDFSINKIRYRGIGGTTRTQATRTQEKIREMVINEEYSHAEKMNSPKIDIFVEKFLDRRKDKRSWTRDKQLTSNLSKFFRGKHINKIDSEHIENYKIKRLKDGVSNSTINRELSCLRRMFNLAIVWGDARKNPVIDIEFLEEPPGRTRHLSKDEIAILLNNCNRYLKPVVLTALNTGMRIGEILGLTWDCVFIENVINPYIEISITKNNKKRFIPLNRQMINLLSDLYAHKKSHNHVFINRYSKPLREIKNQFKFALKESKITDFRFHDLRHTFSSYFVMSGGDLLSLKEILGHQSMKMAERYTHLASSHKRNLINKLDYTVNKHHKSTFSKKKFVYR